MDRFDRLCLRGGGADHIVDDGDTAVVHLEAKQNRGASSGTAAVPSAAGEERRTASPNTHTHTHTHPFNGPFSGNTQVSRYQKGKTDPDFTEARDSESQWHQLGHMQVCTFAPDR